MTYDEHSALIFQKTKEITPAGFGAVALEVFRFQAAHCAVYRRYLSLLNIDVQSVVSLSQIPFLPIQFFKNHLVKTGEWEEEAIFTSSGTTGSATSRHYVHDLGFYQKNTVAGFRQFYGDPTGWLVLALLPSYLERSGSSLVSMAEHFIGLSKYEESGFFLDNMEELVELLKRDERQKKKDKRRVLLLGVSFALLDLAERQNIDLEGLVVMETGGMKGRRRELTRSELHAELCAGLGVSAIHSEYGMTELFSQAYSLGDGKFRPAATMRALAREITDPLSPQAFGKTGVLNIIDLANFRTCSFIATDDLGRVGEDGTFEVLGRLDHSDIRGCNLMVA